MRTFKNLKGVCMEKGMCNSDGELIKGTEQEVVVLYNTDNISDNDFDIAYKSGQITSLVKGGLAVIVDKDTAINLADKERVKDWSESERRRTEEINRKIIELKNAGDCFEEFYEESEAEIVGTFEFNGCGVYKDCEINIYKQHLVYARNRDENGMKVTKGKRVPGTTFYDAAADGDIIDEECIGYKTYKDAEHAVQLYISNMNECIRKYKSKTGE